MRFNDTCLIVNPANKYLREQDELNSLRKHTASHTHKPSFHPSHARLCSIAQALPPVMRQHWSIPSIESTPGNRWRSLWESGEHESCKARQT